MSDDKSIRQVHIVNRDDGKEVSAAAQKKANEQTIAEFKKKAAELGLIVHEAPLIDPTLQRDDEGDRAVRDMAEPQMAPPKPSGGVKDEHRAGLLVGTRTRKRTATLPGQPGVEVLEESVERGLIVDVHSLGIGHVLEKFHEMAVKICVKVTDGAVRLFAGKGKGKSALTQFFKARKKKAKKRGKK